MSSFTGVIILPDLGYFRNRMCALFSLIRYLSVYYCYWVKTSAGGLLVPEGIIRPVVSVSAMTLYIIYIFYRKLQF
jgi:hypothetical protein